MSDKEEKFVCTYCHTEFESFNKNIVLCDKCGTPYHKDCWDESGKCSVYGCDSVTCHKVVESNSNYVSFDSNEKKYTKKAVLVEEKQKIAEKEISDPETEKKQSSAVKNKTVNIIIGLLVSIVFLLFVSIGLMVYKYFHKDVIVANVEIPQQNMNLEVGKNPQNFVWFLDGYNDYEGVTIKNNTPDLIKIKEISKKELKITPLKEGNGSFSINVNNDKIKVNNNNVKVDVKIFDPNIPHIKMVDDIKVLKVGETKRLFFKLDKGTTSLYEINTPTVGSECVSISQKNINGQAVPIFTGIESGAVKMEISATGIFNGEKYKQTKIIDFNVTK